MRASVRPPNVRAASGCALTKTLRAVPPLDCELLMLDEALRELARIDERQARIVELKYFGGLSEEEVGGRPVAVARDDHARMAVGAGLDVSPHDQGPVARA